MYPDVRSPGAQASPANVATTPKATSCGPRSGHSQIDHAAGDRRHDPIVIL